MGINSELLHIPVDLDDMNDQREQIENVEYVQKDLFDRVRFQYQGDTWISQALWEIHVLLNEAHQKMVNLTNSGAFPEAGDRVKPV